MSNKELDESLRRFYAEAKPKLVKNTVARRSSISETPLKGISLPAMVGH